MHMDTFVSRIRSGLFVCLVAAVTSLIANACGNNPVSPSALSNPSGSPNLSILLTDAPVDEVEQVNIYFTSVTVKPEGKPVAELTLQLAENPINLLSLTDKTVSFATGAVEPGTYEFMHVNIDETKSSIIEKGVRKSLQVPSEEIKVLGGFTVTSDHKTTITLDFDAKSSLVPRGSGEWLLRPVIVITGNNSSSQP